MTSRVDGMIIFPAAGVFSGLGPMGVSMFFVSYVQPFSSYFILYTSLTELDGEHALDYSAIISQLIYSAGASGFAGANGSMMIEVVVSALPFALSFPLTLS